MLLAVAMAVDTFTGIVLLQGTRAITMLAGAGRARSIRCPTPAPAARSCGSAATRSWPLVMIVLVIGWLRRAETDAERPAEQGWLEQARRANFAEHAGAAG